MAASLFDSQLYGSLVSPGDASRLFSDSAEVRAMLLVLGAIAKAQGEAGLIPKESAAAIGRAVVEVAIDPGALRKETALDGTPVPALAAALRSEMNAPEHAQFVHWGTTAQDVADTALMLRLRQVLSLIETDLKFIAAQLDLKKHSSDTLAELLAALPALRTSCLRVSFSGQDEQIPESLVHDIRAELAKGLTLSDPQQDWHQDRKAVHQIADWLHKCSNALASLSDEQDTLFQAFPLHSQALLNCMKTGPVVAELLCLPQIALSASALARSVSSQLS